VLHELHIEGLGVIDTLTLRIGPGMTALTGETGAGKTMLVEAISLLVGGRADPATVRPGAAEARIEGRFVVGDEEQVLARVIPAEGRSRAYVDGRLATVANLADWGAQVIDIHGQHSHQSLLGTGPQRAALDIFGAVDLAPLAVARQRLREIDETLDALGGDARSRVRELDLLRFQQSELDAAAILGTDEDERLAAEEDVLADATAHRHAAAAAIAGLGGDGGVLDQLGVVGQALAGRRPFGEHIERLRAVAVEAADVAGELRHAAEVIEDDPERLAAVVTRRQLLRELRRKYGESLADVLDYRAEVEHRLAELEGHAERVAILEAERATAAAAERRAARAIAARRRSSAPSLSTRVEQRLRLLAMPHARVDIAVDGDDPGDDVRFLLAANPGLPLLPLARVASGGELARAMLALRLVLSAAPDTLVFDEVDAGIGGDAASAVGAALAELAGRGGHQVLVVTHLAQVAAAADTQVVVAKQVCGGTTTATAATVEGERRVAEIARMLSGSEASGAAQRHAAALLNAAEPLHRR
jgi:DNA repair protein RecN (Recombination protein N)